MAKLPDGLEYWTADEVAECLSVPDALYSRLWQLLSEAKRPTPLGGDGSGGTVETPDARLSLDNDDKMQFVWNKLTKRERIQLTVAYNKHLNATR